MKTINLKKENKRAVIYCRVSTKEQVEEGNSLFSQEKNCKEYAFKEGYEVAEIFIEQGESAKTSDRPQLQKMLNYCADKRHEISAVLIYKLDRISRNTDDYSQIRLLLKRYGVEIKSTTEYFENSPAGRFMENIIANVAQFDNDVRTERCVGGMKDAMRDGRYVWTAPLGYDNVKIAGRSTIQPNEMADLVRKTFKLVADNHFSIEEVRRQMEAEGLKSKRRKKLTKSHFYKLLKNEVYTGLIAKFGERQQGTFEALIPDYLFQRVQWVLKHRSKRSYQYLRENPDFPLRRFVSHKLTGKKLTGCWAKGRNNRFPYYYFPGKGKNYRKEDFEKQFCDFVNTYKLGDKHLKEFKEKLKECLMKKQRNVSKKREELEKIITHLTDKQTALIQKNYDGYISDTVLRQQLNLIEKELMGAQEAFAEMPNKQINIDDMVDFVGKFLKEPGNTWLRAEPKQKFLLQWFEFPFGVTFDGTHFRTGEIFSLFKVKDEFLDKNCLRVDFKTETSNRPQIPNSFKLKNYYEITKEIDTLQGIFEDEIYPSQFPN